MKSSTQTFIIVTLFFQLCSPFTSSGQGTVTVEMFKAVTNSATYVYAGVTYKPYVPLYTPNFSGIANAMAAMQARYEYHHEILSNEYRKLVNLSMVNRVNQQYVERERPAMVNWLSKNYSKFDLAVEANFTNILNYITTFMRAESINSELRFLNNVNKEIERLKQKDPDTFYRSERYSDIKKALEKLQTCKIEEIQAIAWEYGLL